MVVSRTKHGLKLYAADKDELLKRSQVSRTKENASDYIPLFRIGENYAKTQKESQQGDKRSTADDDRNIRQRLGTSLGERLAEKFSALSDKCHRTQSTSQLARAGSSDYDSELGSIASILSEQVESLSDAVTDYAERAGFIECEGEFTGAVEAVNYGFGQLEQAAKNRNQLAAAVNRLNTATRRVSDNERATLESNETAVIELAGNSQDYKALWHHYRQGVTARSKGELDYRVGRRAFIDGVEQKAIALMLASESKAVQQIYYSDGKERAMKYVNHMTRRICQQQVKTTIFQSFLEH